MNYRIYTYSYSFGWELQKIVNTIEEVQFIINNLDRYEYGTYIIVRHNKKLNMDEVIDLGFFSKEEKRKKKCEKRKSRKH